MNRTKVLFAVIASTFMGLSGCDRTTSNEVDDNAARAYAKQEAFNAASDTVWESRETAFGYASGTSTCFSEIIGTPRWGWSIGPISEGVDTFQIIAGAGRCDTAKGTKVGYGIVAYSDGVARVTYHAYPGQAFFEAHLYVGSERLPRGMKGKYTVAPGQYPHQHGAGVSTTGSFTVTGLKGNPYLVLHLVSGPIGSGSTSGQGGSGTSVPGTGAGSADSTVDSGKTQKDPFAGLD